MVSAKCFGLAWPNQEGPGIHMQEHAIVLKVPGMYRVCFLLDEFRV